MKNLIAERIAALQKKLVSLDLDAAMIYDRENLIYFAGVEDLEGGALAIPAKGEPELFCIWLEHEYIKEKSGIKNVTPFYFPKDNQSTMMGKWLKKQGWTAPKIGFTRYFISLKDYQCLRAEAPGMIVEDIALVCYQLRSIKCPEEISRIQNASQYLKAGMMAATRAVKTGISETEVLAEAEYAMRKAGSQGASFRMQVLTHSRQMLKHPYASAALLENNAPVVIHLGASCEGYVAKMCRSVFLGQPEKEMIKIYEALIAAQSIAIEMIKPGQTTCGEVFKEVARFMEEEGYAQYWLMEHIGYGVGIRQSEFYPIIAKGSPVMLEENMVIDLLLPSIYVPKLGGARITDTILIGKEKNQILTDYPADIIFC